MENFPPETNSQPSPETYRSKEEMNFWSNKAVHIVVWIFLILFFIVNTAGISSISIPLHIILMVISVVLALFEIISLLKSNFKKIIKIILVSVAIIFPGYFPAFFLQQLILGNFDASGEMAAPLPFVLSFSCELLGGNYYLAWEDIPGFKTQFCFYGKTGDYSKPCVSSDQCEGKCITYQSIPSSIREDFHCSEYIYGGDSELLKLAPDINEQTIEEYNDVKGVIEAGRERFIK